MCKSVVCVMFSSQNLPVSIRKVFEIQISFFAPVQVSKGVHVLLAGWVSLPNLPVSILKSKYSFGWGAPKVNIAGLGRVRGPVYYHWLPGLLSDKLWILISTWQGTHSNKDWHSVSGSKTKSSFFLKQNRVWKYTPPTGRSQHKKLHVVMCSLGFISVTFVPVATWSWS